MNELDPKGTPPRDVAKLPSPRTGTRPGAVAPCQWCSSVPCRCDQAYDDHLDQQMFKGREDDWLP